MAKDDLPRQMLERILHAAKLLSVVDQPTDGQSSAQQPVFDQRSQSQKNTQSALPSTNVPSPRETCFPHRK